MGDKPAAASKKGAGAPPTPSQLAERKVRGILREEIEKLKGNLVIRTGQLQQPLSGFWKDLQQRDGWLPRACANPISDAASSAADMYMYSQEFYVWHPLVGCLRRRRLRVEQQSEAVTEAVVKFSSCNIVCRSCSSSVL